MQTEEDKQIQSSLERPGNGLPSFDAIFLKRIGFPVLKSIITWDKGLDVFEREGQIIIESLNGVNEENLFKKVLISKTFGIEDNSRYYSPAMVLWHLIYVGETIQKGIISLSKGEKLDFTVKIENFKPFIEIEKNIVEKYESFLLSYRSTIENSVEDKCINNYHSHPWFGPLNPQEWVTMSALHQWVHRRQIRKILASNA
jgi:hypothetical protein